VNPATDELIEVRNLLSAEGIIDILTGAETNFTGFAPLGVVLVAMLGVGVAERSGLISAFLKKTVLGAPEKLITVVVVFAGVMSSMASDAGYVVLVPVGAIVFAAKGRHPLAGLAAAFAGVSGGFSSNLFITMLDPLLMDFTEEAAHLLNPDYGVEATANWFFMIASTVLITFVGTVITEKIVEPRLGKYTGSHVETIEELKSEEKKGLLYAAISLIILTAVILLTVVPENGILRSETGKYSVDFHLHLL